MGDLSISATELRPYRRSREQADDDTVEPGLETWDIAWTLQCGSRLRINISFSNSPEYSIHPNTVCHSPRGIY